MKRYTLSINELKHPEIAAWLDQQSNVSASIRRLIEAHLSDQAAQGGGVSIDLAGVRQVLEAVLDEKLAHLNVNGSAPASDQVDVSAFDNLLE